MKNSTKQIYHKNQKSQLIYVILALLFGPFGLHNFYAQRWGRGLIQLAITLFTGFVGTVITSLWSVINIFTINEPDELLCHLFQSWGSTKSFINTSHIFKSLVLCLSQSFLIIFIKSHYDTTRSSDSYASRRDILGDYTSCPDKTIIPDADSFKNHHILSKADIIPDSDFT